MVTVIGDISNDKLINSEKWLINSFLSSKPNKELLSFPLIQLGEIVSQRKDGINPQKYKDWEFCYIGLENIESHTGFLINVEAKRGEEIKSRSKIFYEGDLLFGKLRPNLNKVYLTKKGFKGGICSSEFFVLIIDEKRIRPNFLKLVLGSKYVIDQINSFTAGAALPRIHIDDFLKITIPLPPIEFIESIEVDLENTMSILQNYRQALNEFPKFVNSSFDDIFISEHKVNLDITNTLSKLYEPIGGLPY